MTEKHDGRFTSGVVTDYFDTIQMRYVIPRELDKTQIEFVFFGRQEDTEEARLRRVRQGPEVLGPTGAIILEDAAALRARAATRPFSATAEYVVITRENHARGLPIAVIRDYAKDRIIDRVTIIKDFWSAGRPPLQRHLAVGEYQDVVDFSGDVPKFRSNKVTLDTYVLQDAFVYPHRRLVAWSPGRS